ncbi:isopentenyl pyrophosphate isomerase [Paenibacillus darwinianus]|uniref:Isopentenyl-diphosphate delta-isomerase n=1 Tax=Paenibacillus darwinianus TaxID=1380763 RepID=A0A9W5S1E5_9BACL|nr:type 2 isopentenyl-diphosphate Delta-isomerase [Paenibacillus darwinianus]EXX89401.1 isopentenyl pyrophosphate isomerase [Paenibacillus darwinianus]EXX90181.1 isopentenyl pyrophosphate isomerase [Paenibacillus darwinianus]EXX91539.1 isopentenyl pyrophosphate isomerase [Paenibacillus darwinianus]
MTADNHGNAEKSDPARSTVRRKGEHIRICLEENVESGVSTGLERFRFRHNALPELDFRTLSIGGAFLGRVLRTPFLISSMTGGTDESGEINRLLAEAAEARGWAIGLGSMRAAVEDGSLAATFHVRQVAPTIPILANIGAVQLNYGYGAEQCRRAVDMAEAHGLVLHLNGLQELFQPEGDTDFSGLLRRIESVCRSIGVPVGVKEVGWGIDGDTAARLYDAGVAFIDVAGAGGTSWSQVEKHRSTDPVRRGAAGTLAAWGTPTAQCIRDVRARLPQATIIASGGLRTGLDAAKSIALGANLAGFGRSLLPGAAAGSAVQRFESLLRQCEQIEFELKAAMFGIGAGTVEALRATDRLVEL